MMERTLEQSQAGGKETRKQDGGESLGSPNASLEDSINSLKRLTSADSKPLKFLPTRLTSVRIKFFKHSLSLHLDPLDS